MNSDNLREYQYQMRLSARERDREMFPDNVYIDPSVFAARCLNVVSEEVLSDVVNHWSQREQKVALRLLLERYGRLPVK